MRDYWRRCGYGLLEKTSNGQLIVTDDFLRSLLHRPELAPVAESSEGELALHRFLIEQPRAEVGEQQLAAVQDEDARANFAVWLRFRQRLLAQPTLEASYVALFNREGVDVPPVFVHLLTQILVRHILGGEATSLQARAGEMLFRTQRISIQDDGQVMAADDETVRRTVTAGFGSVAELLAQGSAKLHTVDLDVLSEDNADAYWARDESHDMVLNLNQGRGGLDALRRLLERWVLHFMHAAVRIEADKTIDFDQWVWHVGLDAQATGVLNDLYQGREVSEERMGRMLCLFRLEFLNPGVVRAEVAARPVYLAMAMDAENQLKLKPQNLLLNLPLK